MHDATIAASQAKPTQTGVCRQGRYLLADVLVLVQPFLGNVGLAQVHTQLQVLLHDGLMDLLPCSVFLALDDIVQGVQGTLGLAHINELCQSKVQLLGRTQGGMGHFSTQHKSGANWH